MNGIDVKRGVSATMERVVAAAGDRFESLDVVWYGNSAGIKFEKTYSGIDAKVFFPAIDDQAQIDRATFNNLIGYALHEGLGHAMFTDNAPWDAAREQYGSFVHQLINGLEDPRIEQCAIDSGFAPNSKMLFEDLLNSVLADGYVEPDDIKNIPFLCAVEGRRLNGYQVCVPSVVDQSPLAAPIRKALQSARASKNTAGVVNAAVELYKAIQQHQEKQQGQQQDKQQKKDESKDQAGEPQQGDKSEGDTQPSTEPNKSPTEAARGFEKDLNLLGGKPVEPTEMIMQKLEQHKTFLSGRMPAIGTPKLATFEWS